MPKPKRRKELTVDDLLEFICDVAYEQSARECSGGNWFRAFIKKIDERQGATK